MQNSCRFCCTHEHRSTEAQGLSIAAGSQQQNGGKHDQSSRKKSFQTLISCGITHIADLDTGAPRRKQLNDRSEGRMVRFNAGTTKRQSPEFPAGSSFPGWDQRTWRSHTQHVLPLMLAVCPPSWDRDSTLLCALCTPSSRAPRGTPRLLLHHCPGRRESRENPETASGETRAFLERGAGGPWL